MDDEHDTPLGMAAFSGCAEVMDLMLNKGKPSTAALDKPLSIAATYGYFDIVRTLLGNNASVANNALRMAAQGGYLEFAQYLLDHGAPIEGNTQNHVTPLAMAAQQGQVGVVQLLVERGAAIDAKYPDS